MKKETRYLLLTLIILLQGYDLSSGTDDPATDRKIIKVWLIGDSTVTDYSKSADYFSERYPKTGWGQVFQQFMSGENLKEIKDWIDADSVIVDNRAVGGRSTRSFFEEGRWREVYNSLEAGDFVFIQFGHNDGSENKPDRYVDVTGYKEFLRLFIWQSREKGATPVLITPVSRNYHWMGGELTTSHGEYPTAMKEVAAETNSCFIDLTELSMNLFMKMGKEYVTSEYFMNLPAEKYEAYPEGLQDNTHFQPEGANQVARLVYNALKELADKGCEIK